MEIHVQTYPTDLKKLKQFSLVLGDAFRQDPIMSSIFLNRREIELFMFFMLKYFEKFGEIHYTTSGQGVALWLKPGVRFLTLSNLFSQGMTRDVAKLIFSVSPMSLLRLFRISDYLTEHKPTYAHHYLFVIGIDSNAKGQGIGKRLIQFALDRFGTQDPYYLENTNVINNSFYQKFGFQLKAKGVYKGRTFYFMAKPKDRKRSCSDANGSAKISKMSALWLPAIQPKKATAQVL